MVRSLAALGLLLAGAVACIHTTGDRAAAVLRADRERAEALIAADVRRLEAILHASLSYAHSNGSVDTRASLIERVGSGRVDYRAIDTGDLEVRLRGDTAVVTGPVRIEVVAGERRIRLAGVYTAVYWWEEGRWQLAAYQSSPVRSP